MRNLILDNLSNLRDQATFTPELLTAIFWEETQFRNILQIPAGPAVGFGQVQPGTIDDVNRAFKTNFSAAKILQDDSASVLITSFTLSLLFKRLKSKVQALHGYAGSSVRKENAPLPGRWMQCEAMLREIHADDYLTDGVYEHLAFPPNVETLIKSALKAAKFNSNPDDAFPDGTIPA
jgi:hypothetical protein